MELERGKLKASLSMPLFFVDKHQEWTDYVRHLLWTTSSGMEPHVLEVESAELRHTHFPTCSRPGPFPRKRLLTTVMLVLRPFAVSVALLAAQCFFSELASVDAACNSFSARYNKVLEGICVCTAAECDTVSNGYLSIGAKEAAVYQTSKAGSRLAYTTIAVSPANASAIVDIVVDTTVRYQKIIGFGGAFTDAAAINVYQMEAAVQQKLVDAYFSEFGLQYTLARIPIASTDFSTSIYSYNAVVDDFEMKNFSIDVDKTPTSNKLAFIKRAIEKSRVGLRELRFFASAWAPPAWMTEGNSTINAKLKGAAGEPYWKALALYYSKFIDAYEAEGVPIWGLTTQNEPVKQTALKYWQSLRFDTAQERDWIKKDLGPLLKAKHPDVKLMIMDDQKSLLPSWNGALQDPEARQYVDGVGVHWYMNLDFVSKTAGNFAEMSNWQQANPDLFILATEACEGYLIEGLGTGAGTKLLQPEMVWKRGEVYARDIINDLANYATGWMDWNLVLDTKGGPTWVENNVDSPILVDEVGKSEFYKQPMYYVMGHFSKFLPPGSVRVKLELSANATAALANVDRVAFFTPENQVVLVLHNRDQTEKVVRVNLAFEGRTALLLLLVLDAADAKCANWSARFQRNLEGVCVCNATSCDALTSDHLSLERNQGVVFQTSLAGDRLAHAALSTAEGVDAAADFVINSAMQFQKIIGFGGAFTDAAAINVYKTDKDMQQHILDAYFGKSGLQYTVGRIPISSTDFSTSVYSYNEVADDLEMKSFSIDVDKTPTSNKLEFIQRALKVSERNVTLFASSWAPPVWMTKENTTLNCHIKGDKYWTALALYYSKFFSAYESEGVRIWGLTTQNEPIRQLGAPKAWQSLRFTAEEERDFIKKNLGPIMKQNHPDVKIIIMDDQKDEILKWNASLVDPEARQYVSGIGVHWYKNLDFVAESLGNFKELARFHELNPDVFILATEACAGSLIEGLGTGAGVRILEREVVWKRGEIYARDIINDLANYASGWTDWNLVLDTKGGPNWAENNVDAPILVDEVGGKEFYKQPMYYIMGHFSKFLTPGSVQVAMNVSAAVNDAFKKVDRVAFVTPEQQLAIVLSNREATEKTVRFSLSSEKRSFQVVLPGNAVQTIMVATGSAVASNNGSSEIPAPTSLAVRAGAQFSLALLFWIATLVA
ncbi:hypothetical protein PybrP1_009690 [[Pythium] brassicae (nom. inval.)]|nr:hypothetical protein PybrP1_009690 [[Pythium] brassicae (nom. inval.)]